MKQNLKISRGYRLKQATHALIKNLQDLTNSNSERVISKSCKLYLREIFEKENLNKPKNNINSKGVTK